MRASFGVYIMRTIYWDDSTQQVKMIDQRRLPTRLEWISCTTAKDVSEAIRTMAIRGAPAIGAAGAYGVALTASLSTAKSIKDLEDEINLSVKILRNSRPTAINLNWALDRMLKVSHQKSLSIQEIINSLVQEAKCIADEDIQTNKRIAEFGSGLIQDGDVIIHHCNTGSLATVEGGTALGVIQEAWTQGKKISILVDETRPRLQGARLTSWELQLTGIPYEIITDNAAGYFLQKHIATKVMFGADRVSLNGDVANKVGTYMLSLAARANGIPVLTVFPSSSFDPTSKDGNSIVIEMRDESEVLELMVDGEKTVPQGAHALNPAFDITPHHLITAWITDRGILYPPFNPQSIGLMGINRGDKQ